MKKLLKKVLFFVAMTSVVAASSLAAGGVSVGNGQKVYQSPRGFSVVYPEKLSLVVNSDADFRISNEDLVKDKEKTSRVVFRVTENAALDLDDVREWIARQYIGMKFEYIKLPGAEGFYHEERGDGSLKGRYFLLTSNKDLVDINLEAYAAGRGLELIAPIVHTFTYDTTPPVVEKVWTKNKVWPAGSKQKMFIRATDENSGVDFEMMQSYLAKKQGNVNLNTIMGSAPKEEAPGLFSIEFEVNAFIEPGKYDFEGITVYDRAGNAAHWKFAQSFAVQVTNHGPVDTALPEVLEIRNDNPVWRTGETYRIYFHAADDISGVKEVRCGGFVSMVEYDGYPRYSNRCKNVRSEGDGWYSAEYEVEPFLPSGEYILDYISLEDHAKNYYYASTCAKPSETYCENGRSIALPVLKIRIENVGVVDVERPELLEIHFSSTVWKAGETQRIFLKMRDGKSGLALDGRAPRGVILPENPQAPGARTIYMDEPMSAFGGDWYFMDITPNQFMKPGEYYFGYFGISDKAGNVDRIECGYEGMPKECKKSDGSPVKPVRIQVVR